jgi:hypothetical protein
MSHIPEEDELTIIEKIDAAIEFFTHVKQFKTLCMVLEEIRQELLETYYEVDYYEELCEGYEKMIKEFMK